MFANLSYEGRSASTPSPDISFAQSANYRIPTQEAFFSLLDEYFASRPGLLPSPSTSSPIHITSPSRTSLPPSRSPGPSAPTPPARESSPSNFFSSFTNNQPHHKPTAEEKASMTKEQKDAAKDQQRMDLVSRIAIAGVKTSTNTARMGLGMVASNKKMMNSLGDVPGAQGLVRGADGFLNAGAKRNAKRNADPPVGGEAGGGGGGVVGEEGKRSPPPVAEKKGGMSGFMSGKSFGQVTGMWKEPQKGQASTTSTEASPTSPRNIPSAAPTRGPIVAQTVQTTVIEAEGQAQVVYDYAGADEGDLGVQSGQIVNVIEKTSSDWWSCEDGNGQRGLVPANYLKEI